MNKVKRKRNLVSKNGVLQLFQLVAYFLLILLGILEHFSDHLGEVLDAIKRGHLLVREVVLDCLLVESIAYFLLDLYHLCDIFDADKGEPFLDTRRVDLLHLKFEVHNMIIRSTRLLLPLSKTIIVPRSVGRCLINSFVKGEQLVRVNRMAIADFK